jgi:hypothetical protein
VPVNLLLFPGTKIDYANSKPPDENCRYSFKAGI